MTWTFGRKLFAGFTIPILILGLFAFVGYSNTVHVVDNDRWVAHTHHVRKELGDLLSAVQDAETGQRGFLLTGTETYLEPYTKGLADVDRLFDELRLLAADNPEQVRRLDTLRALVTVKLDEYKTRIQIRRTQGVEAAAKDLAVSGAKETMDQIRRVLADMDRAERDLLDQRKMSAQSSAATTKAVMLWGALLGAALIIASGLFISSSLSKQIGAAVQHIRSSSAELQTAANQQASGAREQASAMTEISTTISELLATSRQIAEGSQRVAQVAIQTSTSSQVGSATVERGQEAAAAMRRQVELIVTNMVDLGKKSQQIGSVLEIVAELSEQTNILAINATIEAAGAGEAGKRFAVVADEIRKLADRVGGSTKEIRTLIDDVRSSVNTTVMTTETGSKAVEAGQRSFSDVATSFRQIVQNVVAATEAAKEIELSTKQQASAVEQVTIAITNVAQGTKESEVSTGQTLRTASELASLSRDLLRIVQPDASTLT